MNIQTIKMDKDVAQEKLEQYREKLEHLRQKNLAAEVEKEYESAIRGYRALAKGTPLIDIADVFKRCPFDAEGYPKLAIARADKKVVEFNSSNGGRLWTFSCGRASYWNAAGTMNIKVESPEGAKDLRRRFSQVPLVPAEHRPEHKLSGYHIIWEVEKWHQSHRLRPDRDPYLLKYVFGTLYAVVAMWDLTDLEMAIMKGVGN